MLRCKSRSVQLAAATCCFLAAAAGCNLHRTGHGYVVRSQWSLECGDMGCIPANCTVGQCENCCDCATCPAEPARPDVLPWRTRLKTRIGDRLFHRGECDVQQCSNQNKNATPKRPIQPAPFPAAPPKQPEKPSVPEKSPPAGKTTDLETPKAGLSEPESTRPDLVME